MSELSSSPSSNAISFAAIINAEASRVVATMRQNSKYAILARQTMSAAYGSSSSAPGGLDVDESLVDDPLVQEFMSLRSAVRERIDVGDVITRRRLWRTKADLFNHS